MSLEAIQQNKWWNADGIEIYRQAYNISHTKSKNLNVSHLTMPLTLPSPLKPCVKSSSANRRCSNYIYVINNFIVH